MSLVPGEVEVLVPGVRRLLAPNASMMTGPGTNTYLLGEPPVAVLDPGPPDAAHIEAILAAVPAVQTIFATHTHQDHSSAVAALKRRTGAQVVGRRPPRDGRQDESFAPDIEPRRDQVFSVGSDSLQAIDTPGHASNHVCYLLRGQGLLFSGDHLLDGVTPVILPPDGNMQAYLEALERLKTYPLVAIAPGHGNLIHSPFNNIDAVIAHRARREHKVVAALARLRTATIDELLPGVYDDVPPSLHALARLTLEAHLLKLVAEGRATHEGGRWSA